MVRPSDPGRTQGGGMDEGTQLFGLAVSGVDGKPVGIGPVISGWDGDQPIYYVEMVFDNGTTTRLSYPKRSRGADPCAKMAAFNDRMHITKMLRPQVVLTHDEISFAGLVNLISRLGSRYSRVGG